MQITLGLAYLCLANIVGVGSIPTFNLDYARDAAPLDAREAALNAAVGDMADWTPSTELMLRYDGPLSSMGIRY